MDAVDVEILRSLCWKPFDPRDAARGIRGPWDIARALGVHGNTVKRRLERMHDAGVIRGIHLMLEPSLLGMESAVYAFRWSDPQAKAEGVRSILSRKATLGRPGAIDSYSFVGEEAWLGFFAPAGEPLRDLVARSQTRTGAMDADLVERRSWKVPRDRVSDLDIRILSAFHLDALRPVSEVAAEMGVTPKTVRHRLKRLADLGVFLIVPYWDISRIEGLIPFVLQVETNAPAARMDFFNAFPSAFYRSSLDAEKPHVFLAAATTGGVEAAVQRAQALEGVDLARALLVEDSTPCPHPADAVTPLPRLLAEGPPGT